MYSAKNRGVEAREGRSSVTEGLRGTKSREFRGTQAIRRIPVVGPDLRFALSAPPYGRRSASLRSRPTTGMRTAVQHKKSTNDGKQNKEQRAKQTRRCTRHRLELTSQREQKSVGQADVSCRNWPAGKSALPKETLQATSRTTRVLNRPKRVYADACRANSEN